MPKDNIDTFLREANARLKAARARVTLENRNGYLYIRGTFPPKPGCDRVLPYQQRHALKTPATPETIKHAEFQCRAIGLDLQLGRFSWAGLLGVEGDVSTVGYWAVEFERRYWDRRRHTASALSTWQGYSYWISQLDSTAPMTVDYLVRAIANRTVPDTANRSVMVGVIVMFADCAGLDTADIKRLKGRYSRSSVNLQELPTDAEIEDRWQALKDEGNRWVWVFGVIAAYGIRPHEIFYLDKDFSRFPELRVTDGGKTGGRAILPLHKHWPEMWNLQDVVLPRFKEDAETVPNRKRGNRIRQAFYHYKLRNPYQYRHAWAVRARLAGLDVDAAAHYLGHGVDVHRSVYLRSAGEEPYRAAWSRLD